MSVLSDHFKAAVHAVSTHTSKAAVFGILFDVGPSDGIAEYRKIVKESNLAPLPRLPVDLPATITPEVFERAVEAHLFAVDSDISDRLGE
jgi:hypothetical protein